MTKPHLSLSDLIRLTQILIHKTPLLSHNAARQDVRTQMAHASIALLGITSLPSLHPLEIVETLINSSAQQSIIYRTNLINTSNAHTHRLYPVLEPSRLSAHTHKETHTDPTIVWIEIIL